MLESTEITEIKLQNGGQSDARTKNILQKDLTNTKVSSLTLVPLRQHLEITTIWLLIYFQRYCLCNQNGDMSRVWTFDLWTFTREASSLTKPLPSGRGYRHKEHNSWIESLEPTNQRSEQAQPPQTQPPFARATSPRGGREHFCCQSKLYCTTTTTSLGSRN